MSIRNVKNIQNEVDFTLGKIFCPSGWLNKNGSKNHSSFKGFIFIEF